jgi:predicted glycosyltransferase
MNTGIKIWFDITNTPQVHFLNGLKNALSGRGYNKFIFTARDFSETISLIREKGIEEFEIFGDHQGSSKLKKSLGLFSRFIKVLNAKIDFDISISCGSESAVYTAKLTRKKSIAFGDNDKAKQWIYGYFVDFAFFPDAIDRNILERQGLKNRLYLYPGYKEDVYIADFVPDPSFINNLPFPNYVVVRPENIQANYLSSKVHTITPGLLKTLERRGFNIIFLPRYSFDREYAKGLKRVYIPEKVVDGLNACYFADAVLTGAGTFAREAACLGIPSFSFYSGKELLSVDKKLTKEGKMFFSRDVNELVNKVLESKKSMPDIKRSQEVRDHIVNKLISIINNLP